MPGLAAVAQVGPALSGQRPGLGGSKPGGGEASVAQIGQALSDQTQNAKVMAQGGAALAGREVAHVVAQVAALSAQAQNAQVEA